MTELYWFYGVINEGDKIPGLVDPLLITFWVLIIFNLMFNSMVKDII